MKLLDAQLAAGVRMNAAEFAREHGVSARTVYRHRARVQAEGEWRERSRRPHQSPQATPPDLEAWICKLRAELGVDNGPSSLPVQADAVLLRCKVADNGKISIGRYHCTSVGRAHVGTTVTTIRAGDHATVYGPEGQPIGHVYLDPVKQHVSLTRVA